jgi:hypothetical protein
MIRRIDKVLNVDDYSYTETWLEVENANGTDDA